MSAATATLDPTRCPVCGQSNQCAMEVERATGEKQPPCWCTQVQFEPSVFDKIPEQARGTACVCGACARSEILQGDRSVSGIRR